MKKTITALLLGSICPLAVAADWPGFRGPHGDNSVPSAKIATSFPEGGPKVRWSIDVGSGYGGAAIVGDEVFLMDRVDQSKDVLRCVGLKDGTTLWEWEYDAPGRISHPGSRSVPTVTEDAVYASSGFGHLYCIDRKTHKPRWVVDVAKRFKADVPRFGYAIHPVVHGKNCIIAPTGDSVGLAALDQKTGETVWKSGAIGDSHSSPLLVKILGREMVVMPGSKSGELKLSGFDPKDGKQIFQYSERLGGGIHNSIPNITVVNETTAFLTGGYGQGTKVLKFAAKEGTVEVTRSANLTAGSMLHPALQVGNQLYMTAGRGRGGGRFRGRSRGRRPGGEGVPRPPGPDGSRRPPAGGGPRPGGAGASGQTGLVCVDTAGKVLWSTGTEPGLESGSIIAAGGIIISQDGGDGSLRLIKPGTSYQELAKGKVFTKGPGRELWAPMALAQGLLVMRSQEQMVCVDLRPAAESRKSEN